MAGRTTSQRQKAAAPTRASSPAQVGRGPRATVYGGANISESRRSARVIPTFKMPPRLGPHHGPAMVRRRSNHERIEDGGPGHALATVRTPVRHGTRSTARSIDNGTT